MTPKEELELVPTQIFHHQKQEPALPNIEGAQKIKFSEVAGLQEYLSKEELDRVKAEHEYMTSGPGKIEAILNAEMERLQSYMETKILQ